MTPASESLVAFTMIMNRMVVSLRWAEGPAARRRLVRRQIRQLNHRPDFDGAAPRHGDLRGDGDRFVAILRVHQEVSAQLLLGLREGTVGHHAFALAHPNTGRRRGRLQRRGGEVLAGRSELVRQLRGLAVTPLALRLVQRLFVQVNEQHVSHEYASIRTPFARGMSIAPGLSRLHCSVERGPRQSTRGTLSYASSSRTPPADSHEPLKISTNPASTA